MLAGNVAVGILCSAWSAVLGLAVVPIYLRLLGIEAYGLIGFFATLQAVFQLLDMGITPTVNREVARHAGQGRIAGAMPLVGTLAAVYWLLAIIIGVSVVLASPLIADRWLRTRELDAEAVRHAVVLLGIVIACRWPNGVYMSTLIGAQQLRVSSLVTAATATLSSLGAVLVLTFVAPTLQAFFAWQACVALAGTLAMRHFAWLALGRRRAQRVSLDLPSLKSVWRFSAGMGLVGLLGLVFTQTDKMLLSRLLPLPEYGRYMLATTVTGGLYILVTPLFNALYPRLSALVAQHDDAGLAAAYRDGTRLMTAILFPLAAFVAFFSTDLVHVWTGNAALAEATGPIITLLAGGSALHGVMHMPHALQLAHGQARLPLIVNATLLTLFVPLVLALAFAWGAIGGALAWLVLQLLYTALNTWITHRHFMPELRNRWIMGDVALPLFVSGVSCALVARVAGLSLDNPGARLVAGAVTALLAAACCVAISPRLRVQLSRLLGRTELLRAAGGTSKVRS
jgi:O-antigen/teichoic acid export membrane protein